MRWGKELWGEDRLILVFRFSIFNVSVILFGLRFGCLL